MKCLHCDAEVCMVVIEGLEQICIIEEEDAFAIALLHNCNAYDVLKKRQKK